MKLLIAILFTVSTAWANELKLAWDASPDATVVGYRLYVGTNSASYQKMIDVGTNLTASVTNLVEGRYFFVATAYTSNRIESLPSNEVVAEVPKPPTNSRTVVIQFSGTLTNFQDVGFFKLRLP